MNSTFPVAAVVAALGIAACGSSSPNSSPPSSAGSGTPSAQAQQDLVNFSDCMRSHGVAGFPDPSSPHEFKSSLAPDSPIARSPTFQSAFASCHHLMPAGGPHVDSAAQVHQHVAALLPFAQCMRSHGFSNFPDPTSTGEITHQMLAADGINIHQPAVIEAADSCVSVTGGVLTKAAVGRFVAGQ